MGPLHRRKAAIDARHIGVLLGFGQSGVNRRAIDLASAAVLVVMGILLLTNNLTILSAGLTQIVPWWPSPSL